MARCYNCGCDISEDDKTRLCDDCKKILLPFVKFMDASTSSAVRRLVSNEENLRNAGVTDSGMDYLLRICELHDKSKTEEISENNVVEDEKAELPDEMNTSGNIREIFAETDDITQNPHKTAENDSNAQCTDIEVPLDKPLKLIRKEYGQYLPAAEIVLGIIAALLVVWFFVDMIAWSRIDFAAIAGALASGVAIYAADVLRKMIHDVEELKKHFR